ncbi:elongator complex protein 6-like [Cloeon dipterum]|uniref:elongator complex protein 6-like n=1 Tax=Cloeon dipterum TaxID=197152 RepID=UPI0032201BB5
MDSKPKESFISVQMELQKRDQHIGKMIGIVENGNNSHGNHILSTVVDHALKNKEAVCFVALMHPQSHYQYVGNQIGFNLKSHIDKQQVKFIDVIQATQGSVRECKSPKLDDSIIEWIYQTVQISIRNLHERYSHVNIIIDDISVLLSLACNVKRVQCLLQWLLFKSSDKNDKTLALAILTHVEPEDEESSRLGASVRYFSKYLVNVTPLRTVILKK